jgi:hypothetical protein
MQRSRLLRDTFTGCEQYIRAHRQQFISVAVTDPSVVTVAFNVFRSVVQVYHFIQKHFDILKDIFRALLWMFVKDIKVLGSEVGFVSHTGVVFDRETLEVLIFWSIIFIFEAGETRRLLETSDLKRHTLTQSINDFIFLFHPSMFQVHREIGLKNYDALLPLIAGHLSSQLALCDCVDIWIASFASPSFLEFTEYILIACLFFNFPNVFSIDTLPDQDILPIIEQAFASLELGYLETAAFVFAESSREWIGCPPPS